MKHSKHITLFILFIIVIASMGCRGKKEAALPEMVTLDLLRSEMILCGSGVFGQVSMSLSCDEATRKTFDLGLSLLHSFEYEEAEKAFVQVMDRDPGCAMAYWGIAMSNFHALWMQSGTDYLEKGDRVLRAAKDIPKDERSADYLDAIGAFYENWENTGRQERIKKFQQKMEALYYKYQEDKEAAVFYALALQATADPSDKSYTKQLKAGKILEGIFPDNPDHPGIAHYIIHAYDYPELAHHALPTARRYAKIAPASAHAQHMPSHIFTRLGLWDEAIASNLKSTEAALCYGQSIAADAHWGEELHGMDYLVYAYLQKGDNAKAEEQLAYLKTFRKVFPADFKIAYSSAAIPSRIALENKNWDAAAVLQLPRLNIDWSDFPWERSLHHFARGLGAVHLKDADKVSKELDSLQACFDQLMKNKQSFMANQVQIQLKSLSAWQYFMNGATEKALLLMREAAEQEDATAKHPVTPGEVIPAREQLADMLFKDGKYREALKTYENSLATHPNRFNAFLGAAKSAGMIPDKKKENYYYSMLIKSCEGTTGARPELSQARTFLAGGV